MKPELLIEEARRTRQLLSKLDGELRKRRRGRRISPDTWSEIIVQAVGQQWGVSCVHFCHGGEPYISDMAEFFRERKLSSTFVTARREPDCQSHRRKNGIHRYTLDEIRLDDPTGHEPD